MPQGMMNALNTHVALCRPELYVCRGCHVTRRQSAYEMQTQASS